MLIDFFIRRPIFTSVCSVIIIIAGLICIPLLPVSQYPQLAPPTVTVNATYVGANSETVEYAVTTILEEAINGVESMKYMTSQSGNDGSSSIVITFDLERDQDIAAVDVQNYVSSTLGLLPEEVKRTGVSISKQSTSTVAAVAFFAENGEYDDIYITNYVEKYVLDPIKRIKGVGGVKVAGERKYSMRIWLDPNKLSSRKLTANDVVDAVKEQNTLVPAGSIGQPPCPDDQSYQMSVRVKGRLTEKDQFENIVLKANNDGTLVKIKDVGRVELGSEFYSSSLSFNKKDSIGLIVYQLIDANSLTLYDQMIDKLNELQKDFPPGLKYEIAFETITFVRESIKEVVFTLFMSIALVVAVIFFFLQSFRSTLIPVITIPVSLVGTLAILKVFGFSINTLSLFGIVLATGLVVDDAIVVIENIQRNMTEKGLSPIKAASEGMKEVTGAVIASTLVLAAVFLPVAAFPGTTGQLYKQFALTIVFSVSISLFNALTLTPALSALLLRPEEEEKKGFFAIVESGITKVRDLYHSFLSKLLKFWWLILILFVGMLCLTYLLLIKVPGGFVPNEDQGYFITTIQAPEGTSLPYTKNVVRKVENMLQEIPEITSTFAISGFNFNGTGANLGMIYSNLKDIGERHKFKQSARYIVHEMNVKYSSISEAVVVAFEPPAIKGMGNVGGFQFEILDQGSNTLKDLQKVTQQIVAEAKKSPVLEGIFTGYTADTPQLEVEVDRDRAKALGVPLNNIFSTLQVFLGSYYVNDFDYIERVFKVYVQADTNFRDNPDDIDQFYVRSDKNGALIPLSSMVRLTKSYTAQIINHYNIFRSAEINGTQAQGYSSGEAITEMERIAKEILPQGYNFCWSGISLEQVQAGKKSIIMFALGLLFVYLFLAAQYESLIDPFIIILAVPLAIFGALLAQMIRGLDNDIFCQIGLVMLIGLACKNSILIVEFANHLMTRGKKPVEAVLEAAKTRFRPIVMTSLAFILGVLPLVFATGAGAAGRNSMGTAVFGGMFFSTALSLLVVPILFLVAKGIEHKISELFKKKE